MREGETVVQIKGTIVELRGVHGEDRTRGRRRHWGEPSDASRKTPSDSVRVTVDQGNEDTDGGFMYDVPAEAAKSLHIGQRIVIEIKMGATGA